MASSQLDIVVKLIDQASKNAEKISGSLRGIGEAGQSVAKVGGALSLGVTAPLAAAGAMAINSANQINEGLANVASLGVENVEEYRDAVQQLTIDVGKSTEDLTGGLYQVVSAFGETSDTMAILEINAKAAAAGLATTEEAIALTSAVTKGYGDTSADAVQKAADLAFQTVQLGQTTFPELAASMGKVVPLAATLGVTQEELAAQMATLTGVTGSASEVSTQLRATYQALLKPTADMAGSINQVARALESQGALVENDVTNAWRALKEEQISLSQQFGETMSQMIAMENAGKTGTDAYKDLEKQLKSIDEAQTSLVASMDEVAAGMGQSIVESVGFTEALNLISQTADGNTNTLGKMFGSVESLNAVIALGGPQADVFAEKLEAMSGAAGAAGEAFSAQTEGVNSAAFEMQQLRQQVQVIAQDLGQALIPALSEALAAITPLLVKVAEWAQKFTELDPAMQRNIVIIGAVVAAIGPLLAIVGAVATGIGAIVPIFGALGTALGVLLSPVGLVVAAVAGLVAILFDVGGAGTWAREKLEAMGLEGMAERLGKAQAAAASLVETIKGLISGEISFGDIMPPNWIEDLMFWKWPELGVPDWIKTLFDWAWPVLGPVGWAIRLMSWSWPTLSQPRWLSDLLNWEWPSLPSLPGFLGGGGGDETTESTGGGGLFGRATGTSFFGGGRTWVGETGPELVTLPRGSMISPAGYASQVAAAGAGVTINVNATVNNEMDAHVMARRIADIIQRRGM